MSDRTLTTYEIDYGDGAERFTVPAGGNLAQVIMGYAEANGYAVRTVGAALALNLTELEHNALEVALDHFVEFMEDVAAYDKEDPNLDEKLAAVRSLRAKITKPKEDDDERIN